MVYPFKALTIFIVYYPLPKKTAAVSFRSIERAAEWDHINRTRHTNTHTHIYKGHISFVWRKGN